MIDVNYLAVLIAAIAAMVVGFAWYSQALFGKQWMKLMGYTMESMKKEKKDMGKWYALMFVLALVTAYVLSHVMVLSQNFYHDSRLTCGLTSAFWMWLGFVMPVQLMNEVFGGKKWKLFYIKTGHQLVSLLVMGIVLGLM